MQNPFRYFNFSPEIIRLTVMLYIRYPLSLRQVEDLLHERGIDICHETVRLVVEIGSVHCLPQRSESAVFTIIATLSGAGTLTRSS